jgi:predicted SprT family Zn-dependent metalloprotease
MLPVILNSINYLASHSWSLLQNKINNVSEQFNSVINKYISGKRVNFIQRASFETRVKAAVVSFNSKEYIRLTHKMLGDNTSPGTFQVIINYNALSSSTSIFNLF